MDVRTNLRNALLDYVTQSLEATLRSTPHWEKVNPFQWQSLRAMVYLYVGPDNPLRQSGALADGIRELYRVIQGHSDPPDNRLTGQLAEVARLLDAANARDLLPGLDDLLLAGAKPLADKLRSYLPLTHFAGANTGTGTNHVAVYCCSVYRAGEWLERAEDSKLARKIWSRLVRDQVPDGYWAETIGGPTTLYNHLTTCCAGRMARWTGDAASHRAAQLGARFQRRFSYPDGCDVETIDGRCRYHRAPMMWGGFIHSETPEGRGYMARKLETLFERVPPERTTAATIGETLALLCEDHELWVEGLVGTSELERPYAVETLRVPGGVRRHGPWFVTLQGIIHLTQASGGFTIDRNSLLSLWHERAALILNGSGEPGVTRAQSFRMVPVWERNPDPVPARASVAMGRPGTDDPARLLAEYRGGTAQIEAHFLSENEARFDVHTAARADRYPIPFTLQLEIRRGDTINGIPVSAEPLRLSGRELKGKIETERFQITFPSKGAKFLWPHDPHNPYDVVKHKSSPEMYVSLLTLPVGPEGIQVTARVP